MKPTLSIVIPARNAAGTLAQQMEAVLAQSTDVPFEVLLAIPLVALKVLLFIVVLAVIEASLAKLRLFRIPEFLGAAFVTVFVALIVQAFAP